MSKKVFQDAISDPSAAGYGKLTIPLNSWSNNTRPPINDSIFFILDGKKFLYFVLDKSHNNLILARCIFDSLVNFCSKISVSSRSKEEELSKFFIFYSESFKIFYI